MMRLDEVRRALAETAARLIDRADAQDLPDMSATIGLPPAALQLLARAHVELRDQVRALHDLVDQTDPRDPIGAALTAVGLERRPREPVARPRLVRESPQSADADLVKLYCRVMGEAEAAFAARESFVVRVWDGMDGCWSDCTGAVSREEALRYWAERTGDGTHHVAYAEVDYYRIFPGGTRMAWDGTEGRELHR